MDKAGYTIMLDDYIIPVTPSSIEYTHHPDIETGKTANDIPYSMAHQPELEELSFEFQVPVWAQAHLPYMHDNVKFKTNKQWEDYLNNCLKTQRSIELLIDRGVSLDSAHYTVFLKEWSRTEDAEKEDWFTYKVSFVMAVVPVNQEIQALETHGLILTKNARGWNR